MNIVIVGAGKSGLYLAQELKGEHDVTLIEERFDRSDVVAAMMPDITRGARRRVRDRGA